MLADLVIPADGRSGSATEAEVPEFIDFTLTDDLAEPREREDMQTAVRGGLAWLDRECRGRFERPFVECADGAEEGRSSTTSPGPSARPRR